LPARSFSSSVVNREVLILRQTPVRRCKHQPSANQTVWLWLTTSRRRSRTGENGAVQHQEGSITMTQTSVAGAVVVVGELPRRSVSRAPWWRWFYLAITLILIAIVVRGFWPSYFGHLLRDGVTRPSIIHVHAAVFSGWMVLLLAQVSLVSMGRVRIHRRLGNIGIAYGALVLVIGLVVSFVAPVLHVRAGEWTLDRAAGFILLPLVDMVLFAGLFGAAVAYRRTPEIHKRMILAATVALAFAAVARMSFRSPVVFLLVWLSPLFAAMAFDLFTRRRVHPVHFVNVAVLAAAFLRIFFMESEGWLRIGRALLVPFV
jgi:hypothetical protein